MINLYRASIVVVISFLLQGCLNVASTSAQAVYNRHNLEKNMIDQYITMKAYKAVKLKTNDFKDANISISTFNKEVLLAGQVPETWQKSRVEQLVRDIPNIERIYNMIHIESPSSSLTRISDSWITAKVKAKLLASEDLDASTIKVVTENGTVYLMAILKPEEADAAVDIARNTQGVQSVVKIFSYMHISKNIKVPA